MFDHHHDRDGYSDYGNDRQFALIDEALAHIIRTLASVHVKLNSLTTEISQMAAKVQDVLDALDGLKQTVTTALTDIAAEIASLNSQTNQVDLQPALDKIADLVKQVQAADPGAVTPTPSTGNSTSTTA